MPQGDVPAAGILPVEALLPAVVEALARHPSLVLTAQPGAGKTTLVPQALLEAGLAGGRQVVALQPRRIAARAAASWVARMRGSAPGEEVGWRVRFEERGGPCTKLWFVTDGLLLRMLERDPYLEAAGVVVLDEFHERRLASDLCLALLRELQETVRPDLRLVVMSATLDAQPIATFLGGCPVLGCPGRLHPVEVRWQERPDPRPLHARVAGAVAGALASTTGHVLVFLPGAAEIRRAAAAVSELRALGGPRAPQVLPLHGDMPLSRQERALAPSARRKVLLATNVAETSLTVEGVTAVVDSGLERVLRHDLRRGVDALRTQRISRASAEQRAGRAGRTGPGVCLRLWTRAEHAALPASATPEVRRADLTGAVLELAALGRGDPAALAWLEPPPEASLRRARSLLEALGALRPSGEATERGREMARFGVPPRVARMLVEASRRGCSRRGALLAALLGERDVLLEGRTLGPTEEGGHGPRSSGPSDLLLRADLVEEALARGPSAQGARAAGLDPAAVAAVARAWERLARSAAAPGPRRPARGTEAPPAHGEEEALLRCVFAAFPDRLARRRAEGSSQAVMVGGRGVVLGPSSIVRDAELFVVVDAEDTGSRRDRSHTLARMASLVRPQWLEEMYPEHLGREAELVLDPRTRRVLEVRRRTWRGLCLEETTASEVDRDSAGGVLAAAAREDPRALLGAFPELDRFLARLAWLAAAAPELGLPVLGNPDVGEALAPLCAGRRAMEEVERSALLQLLRARLGREAVHRLEREAPDRIRLPGGRSAPVDYACGRDPRLAARIQEVFGMAECPRLAGGRVPVVLELLAPNRRPVQVTADLPSFWSGVYPRLRRQLQARYPRHAWPEDPLRP